MAPPQTGVLNGAELQALFRAAVAHLDAAASAIDAINVYPVPDGDTGSNMSATLREAVRAGSDLDDGANAGDVIAAIAKGGLYGARGNSGVILSQALRGFSEGTSSCDAIDARALAEGLTHAAERAYGAVAEPREGTMLTVLRAAGKGATRTVAAMPGAGSNQPCLTALTAAIEAAERAQAETIDILPELREAGVTDSGGEGICTILRGLRAGLLGEPVPESGPDLGRPREPVEGESAYGDDDFGYCTEFIVERLAGDIDVARLRAALQTDANSSIVVVGDTALAKVHIHTRDPDTVLNEARRWGSVVRVKVDDMTEQAERFRASGRGATAGFAVLALSRGLGFDEVFRSLGATVTDLGAQLKPAAGDIARIADELHVPDVIVLPNHHNVHMAAEQAVDLATSTLHIVPSKTLAEGVAALVALDVNATAKDNLVAMIDAARGVRTVEVTIAAAARTTEGITVKAGEALALLDTKLVATASTQEDALLEGLHQGGAADAELVTVYVGEEAGRGESELQELLSAAFPGIEIEIIHGGQSLYGYVASIE